ncbi:hypothetical protein X777_16269 [Ooceraea biroi]|nr:hypothetical protein X777_16269 [Ooceraea biroi]
MFGLDSFGEWEDLILYKQENRAIIEKSVWVDKLCSGGAGELFSMRLIDIKHVGISTEMGLSILHRNGETITLSVKGLTSTEMQDLKREINYFLNMSRLKYLDHMSIDPSERLLLPCDSEEYLQNLSKTYLPVTNESTISDNVLSSSKLHQVQQNLSYPTLIHEAQANSCQSANLRRGPYTKNLTHLDYIKHIDNIRPCNLSKLDKERD